MEERTEQYLGLGGSSVEGGVKAGAAAARRRRHGWRTEARRAQDGAATPAQLEVGLVAGALVDARAGEGAATRAQLQVGLVTGALGRACARAGGGVRTS